MADFQLSNLLQTVPMCGVKCHRLSVLLLRFHDSAWSRVAGCRVRTDFKLSYLDLDLIDTDCFHESLNMETKKHRHISFIIHSLAKIQAIYATRKSGVGQYDILFSLTKQNGCG